MQQYFTKCLITKTLVLYCYYVQLWQAFDRKNRHNNVFTKTNYIDKSYNKARRDGNDCLITSPLITDTSDPMNTTWSPSNTTVHWATLMGGSARYGQQRDSGEQVSRGELAQLLALCYPSSPIRQIQDIGERCVFLSPLAPLVLPIQRHPAKHRRNRAHPFVWGSKRQVVGVVMVVVEKREKRPYCAGLFFLSNDRHVLALALWWYSLQRGALWL